MRSETSLCSQGESTRHQVVQNRRGPPKKPSTRLELTPRRRSKNQKTRRLPNRCTSPDEDRRVDIEYRANSHPRRHSLDDDEASMAKNKLLTSHQNYTCRRHPATQLAGVMREGQSCRALDSVARPCWLLPQSSALSKGHACPRFLRRVESMRGHGDVSDLS